MEKLGSIIGLPVLETETGKEIGEIGDILVNVDGASLHGLIIGGESWFTDESFLAFGDLVSIGRDAVMISNQHAIQQIDTLTIENYNYYLRDLVNKEIFTDTGLRLGLLTDIIFNNLTGEIKGYQISDSIIIDLLYGPRLMPLPEVQLVGQDKVIVPEAMVKLLHEEEENTVIQ